MRTLRCKPVLMLGLAAWVTTVGVGLTRLTRYEYEPGTQSQAPLTWPSDSGLPRADAGWSLLMFVHPQCPCTRASLDELAGLLSECPRQCQTCVVFYRPRGFTEGWERTSLWTRAASIPGIVLACDANEFERERFGVVTSGQVLLYDSQRRLRYRGGLTRARGASGTSHGRKALVAILRGQELTLSQAPVFGCSLVTDQEASPIEQAGVAQ